jgi:hypothetical protein
MNISLDYDDTYTRAPFLWDMFIQTAKSQGHKVYCVTMRRPNEGADVIAALGHQVEAIHFTSRHGKRNYMFKQGIRIDVWIDDEPGWILQSAADATTCDYCGCDTNTWHQQHVGNCPNIPF